MVKQATDKIISIVLFLVLVAIGILGIVLPILPGIPFLIVAAIIASRHIPALERYLQQHPYTAKSLRQSRRFSGLTLWAKIRFCCWAFLQMAVDCIEWSIAFIRRVFRLTKR